MKHLHVISLLCLLGCSGCGSDSRPIVGGSSDERSSEQQGGIDGQKSSPKDRTLDGDLDTTPATREDLDKYLANFGDATNWSYGERTPGELAGTWVSVDDGGHRVVFDANGCQGAFSEDFNGNMTAGLYAVSPDGRIVAFSKWNGIGLGSRFKFEGQTITGPRGPNPSAQWKRIQTTKRG